MKPSTFPRDVILERALEEAKADLIAARDFIFKPHTFAPTLALIDLALRALKDEPAQ